jgi:hypothetical protein
MPREPIDLPPAVARAFARTCAPSLAEKNPLKRDEIAARQLHALREYQKPREKKLRL